MAQETLADQQRLPAPSADELTALAALLGRDGSGDSIAQRYDEARRQHQQSQQALEASLLEQVPRYLSLHSDLQSCKTLLAELESFLDVFYNDLSVLSTQMSALQSKSIVLGQRLKNRRQLEAKLRAIVTDIVLEPRYVELIFADESSAGRAGLEVWKDCAERLSACLMACADLEGVLRDELALPRGATFDVKALREARDVAEGCRVMAVSKIRPLLISTFAPLRASLSTNMPVLQAVLLKSYRPLFMFLSHHAPRVAIDVQRAYVAAARLYFETGFRRYERSLGRLRDREKAKATAEAGATAGSGASFTTSSGKASGLALLGAASGSTAKDGTSTAADPWISSPAHLEHARIADGPAVTLAYLADDSSYRAPIEALFRSLSLTFLDNAASEYCFLARFFEGIDLDIKAGGGAGGSSSNSASQVTGSSAVKVRHSDAQEEPLPEDSASAHDGGDDEDEEPTNTQQKQGTVVRLSEMEKARIRGRGALDELWKQVMDPVVGTYSAFVNSIVALQPPLLSLYTMLKLNDRILAELGERGVESILQGTFMAFKLKAWPMLQKQFDDAIESVKRVRAGSGGAASTAAATATGLFGFFGGSSAAASTQPDSPVVQLICRRYAALYSSIVQLSSGGSDDEEEAQDASVFASLHRLRTEVEGLLGSGGGGTSSNVASCHQLIRRTLETGPATVSLPRIQAEMSHWTEAGRNRLRAV